MSSTQYETGMSGVNFFIALVICSAILPPVGIPWLIGWLGLGLFRVIRK